MSTVDLSSLNPYIRVAMRSVLPKGYVISQRIIFDYELIYIERGRFTFCYAGKRYPCQAGQFLLIRPGIPHSFEEIEEDLSQPHIHFDMIYHANSRITPVSFKDLPQLTREERALIGEDIFKAFPKEPLVSFSDATDTLSIFFRVIDRKNVGASLSAKAHLLELIDRLIHHNFAELLSAPQPEPHDISRQIKDFIDASPAAPIDLAAIEQQFSYSRFYLERQFKKAYGMSLIAYRNEQRLRLAKEMLSRPTSISKVSEQLGFSSIYAFSRAFKNRFGICPSAYQKK